MLSNGVARKLLTILLGIIVAMLITGSTEPANSVDALPENIILAHDRQTLSDWESKFELEVFLGLYGKFPITLKANKDGYVVFGHNCEDFAFQLRDRAEQLWGKRLDPEVLTRQEYHQYYGEWLELNFVHVINKAVIGNEVYYVEPQRNLRADGRVWLGLYLD